MSASMLLSAASVLAFAGLCTSQHTIPLSHQRVTVPQHHAVWKWGAPTITKGFVAQDIVPEVEDQMFWFANFTIGASPSLSLLIDTGSADVYLNPGVYRPGSTAEDTGTPFSITFATTNSDGSGTETLTGEVWRDIVGISGDTTLTVPNQELGNTTSPSTPSFPHDGLVGFAFGSAFNGTPWFLNLCSEKKVDECRFGLAYRTDGTGEQYFGFVAPEYKDKLSVTPLDDTIPGVGDSSWSIVMDVAIDNKVVANLTNQPIVTDSGTSVIYGPIDAVRQIFTALDIPSYEQVGDAATNTPSYLFGYYPCDKPPTAGFAVGNKSTIFNIAPTAWSAADNGNNNCTATLQGTDGFPFWLVGQAFFQGKYVDHDVDGKTMGFANW